MSNLINVNIRPHLISFLFQEFEGEIKAVYENKKVKLAKISKSSVLGQMIMVFKTRAKKGSIKKANSFSVFLTLTDNTVATGLFHEKISDSHFLLELLPEDALLLNDFLESIFRISLVQFVKGYVKSSTDLDFVNQAVHAFMIQHDLYNTELDPESLRGYYYKSVKKKHSLTKIQNQVSSQSKYYSFPQTMSQQVI